MTNQLRISSDPREIQEAFDQLEILVELCCSFHDRHHYVMYKPIATCLRFLLTGSSGDEGFLEIVTGKTLTLPPLLHAVNPSTPDDCISWPANCLGIEPGQGPIAGMMIRCEVNGLLEVENSGRLHFFQIFDANAARLSVATWLKQDFLNLNLTIGRFINQVANKDGGAHIDLNHGRIRHFQRLAKMHQDLIAAIAMQLHPLIVDQLRNAWPNHPAAHLSQSTIEAGANSVELTANSAANLSLNPE